MKEIFDRVHAFCVSSLILAVAHRPSILRPIRCNTSFDSSSPTMTTVLPNILTKKSTRTKKRVRFSLKLESIAEDSTLENVTPLTFNERKSTTINPNLDERVFCGKFVEYFQRPGSLIGETYVSTRFVRKRSISPTIESEQSSSPIQENLSPLSLDLTSVSPSLIDPTLPRIIDRSKPTKKPTAKKSNLPLVHSSVKPRITLDVPLLPNASKKLANQKNSPVKRSDSSLSTTEKILPNERPISALCYRDDFRSKKYTEILTNPLPGVNNPIHRTSERLNFPKIQKKDRKSVV